LFTKGITHYTFFLPFRFFRYATKAGREEKRCAAGETPAPRFTPMKAILRIEKVTGQGSATGKTNHNLRLVEVPNADPERSHLNQVLLGGNKGVWELANDRIEEAQIKRKIRPDAVRAVEILLTASPEYFERDADNVCRTIPKRWVQLQEEFLRKQFGKNLVQAVLHMDEKSPHIHAIIVPLKEGKLSAKELFTPQTLRQLQTDYAEAMKSEGLERGVEGSRAKHTTMKRVYGVHEQIETLEELKTVVAEDLAAKEVKALEAKVEEARASLPTWLDELRTQYIYQQQEKIQKDKREDMARLEAEAKAQVEKYRVEINAKKNRIIQKMNSEISDTEKKANEELSAVRADLNRQLQEMKEKILSNAQQELKNFQQEEAKRVEKEKEEIRKQSRGLKPRF
jgi:hypothetical protein